MSDIIDQANDVTDLIIRSALSNRETTILPFTGKCRYCEESLTVGSFCDADCRDDWQNEQRRNRCRKD